MLDYMSWKRLEYFCVFQPGTVLLTEVLPVRAAPVRLMRLARPRPQ